MIFFSKSVLFAILFFGVFLKITSSSNNNNNENGKVLKTNYEDTSAEKISFCDDILIEEVKKEVSSKR